MGVDVIFYMKRQWKLSIGQEESEDMVWIGGVFGTAHQSANRLREGITSTHKKKKKKRRFLPERDQMQTYTVTYPKP